MTTSLTSIILNLIAFISCSFTITLAIISYYFSSETDKMQKFSYAFIASAFMLIMAIFSKEYTLLTYGVLITGLLILVVFAATAVNRRVILSIGIVSSILIAYLHLAGFLEFVTIIPILYIQVIALLPFLIAFALLRRSNASSQLEMAMMMYILSTLIIIFVEIEYATYITALLYGSAALAIIHQTISYYLKDITKSTRKLKELQDDFEYNVRKEASKRTFYMDLANEKMSKISKTDALTKSLNKKAILDTIERLVDDKRMPKFTVLMFDIDNFKGVNDNYGHITGDVCLKTLSSIARKNIRDDDFLGRYGGDEFIIVLSHIDVNDAKPIAERFRRKVNETKSPHFSISLGMSSYPVDGNTQKDLLEVADQGLYYSKEKGKNAVSYSNSDFPETKF